MDWRKQCWKAKNFPSKKTSPPYMTLFPSVLRTLEEKNESFFSKNILSDDALAWFENAYEVENPHVEGAEGDNWTEFEEDWTEFEEEKLQEYLESLGTLPPSDALDYAEDAKVDYDKEYLNTLPPSDALEYAVDAPVEYERIVYGDNPDALPDTYDEAPDEEGYIEDD